MADSLLLIDDDPDARCATAEELGISRATLVNKIKTYALDL